MRPMELTLNFIRKYFNINKNSMILKARKMREICANCFRNTINFLRGLAENGTLEE